MLYLELFLPHQLLLDSQPEYFRYYAVHSKSLIGVTFSYRRDICNICNAFIVKIRCVIGQVISIIGQGDRWVTCNRDQHCPNWFKSDGFQLGSKIPDLSCSSGWLYLKSCSLHSGFLNSFDSIYQWFHQSLGRFAYSSQPLIKTDFELKMV